MYGEKMQEEMRAYERAEVAHNFNTYPTKSLIEDCDHYIGDLNYNERRNRTLTGKKIRNPNMPSHIIEILVRVVLSSILGVQINAETDSGDLNFKAPCGLVVFESKAYSSGGPTSFGPTEKWSWIVFVDATRVREKHFKVYLIPLSNTSQEWRSINLRKEQVEFDSDGAPDLPEDLNAKTGKELRELCRSRGVIQGTNKQDCIDKLVNNAVGSKYPERKTKTYGDVADAKRRGELRAGFEDIIRPQLSSEQCILLFDGGLSEIDTFVPVPELKSTVLELFSRIQPI